MPNTTATRTTVPKAPTLRYCRDLAAAFDQYEGPDRGVRELSQQFHAAVRDVVVAVGP